MAPREDDHDSMPGQDSFIDVICNMVGILIILVMVVGARATSAPWQSFLPAGVAAPSAAAATVDPAEVERRRQELAEETRQLQLAEEQGRQAYAQAVAAREQSTLIDAQRDALALVRADAQQEIAQRRAKLSDKDRDNFDVQSQIVASQIELDRLTQEQLAVLAAPRKVETIEAVPTPLAQTVNGDEIHVRLKRGQLAVVPVDQLLADVQNRGGDYLRAGLRDRSTAQDMFGPVDGFRLKLTVERIEEAPLPGESRYGPKRSALVVSGIFLPQADDVGQAVEQALLPDAALARAIRTQRSASVAVTAWVYPDSYGALRTLKRQLWDAGVPLAVRPLDNGQPIVFSTLGTRSSAQ